MLMLNVLKQFGNQQIRQFINSKPTHALHLMTVFMSSPTSMPIFKSILNAALSSTLEDYPFAKYPPSVCGVEGGSFTENNFIVGGATSNSIADSGVAIEKAGAGDNFLADDGTYKTVGGTHFSTVQLTTDGGAGLQPIVPGLGANTVNVVYDPSISQLKLDRTNYTDNILVAFGFECLTTNGGYRATYGAFNTGGSPPDIFNFNEDDSTVQLNNFYNILTPGDSWRGYVHALGIVANPLNVFFEFVRVYRFNDGTATNQIGCVFNYGDFTP